MDVYEVIESVGAEIVCNRATARIDGAYVVVAEVVGDGFALTEDGKAVAALLRPAAPPRPAAKPRTSKPRTRAVQPATDA
jgi:hypothetical protein